LTDIFGACAQHTLRRSKIAFCVCLLTCNGLYIVRIFVVLRSQCV